MLRLIILISLLPFSLLTAQQNESETTEVMIPSEEEIIMSILEFQREAWNQGNIEQFMEGYWNSEKLSFTGSNGVTRGWTATKANYLKKYPTREAMGQLDFEVIELNLISEESAHMIGKWQLRRTGKENVGGYFTLIWRKIDGRWLIVSDHTS